MQEYFDKGFCKVFNTHCRQIVMTENSREIPIRRQYYCVVQTDLSKAFVDVFLELFFAKLHTYEFNTTALKLMHGCRNDSEQRITISSSYSTCGFLNDSYNAIRTMTLIGLSIGLFIGLSIGLSIGLFMDYPLDYPLELDFHH